MQTTSGASRDIEVILIAAVARDGAIGHRNALLWKLPGDLRHFKNTTTGAPIIMGRKTWDSIGRPLPGRLNIVVTRQSQWSAAGASRAASLDEALGVASTSGAQKVFVIGGAKLYAAALAVADELILTEVQADFEEADTRFPPWDNNRFTEASRSEAVEENGLRYSFVAYRRRPDPS